MKPIILFLCLCSVGYSSGLKDKPAYIEGEFILELNRDLSYAEQDDIIETLANEFSLELTEELPIGELMFLAFKGDDNVDLEKVCKIKFLICREFSSLE